MLRQTWTLTAKNFLIILGRHAPATAIRAFVLPIAIILFLSFAKNFFVPPALFGIGATYPVRTFADGLKASSGVGRDTVAFVNNGFTGGEIECVINSLVPTVTNAGKNAVLLTDPTDLASVCRASLRGVTHCYGAVIFYSSPTEGSGGYFNYTIRDDSALGGGKINVDRNDNDAELYMLPFQRAIDLAITSINNGSANRVPLPGTTEEYAFTSLTPQERDDSIRVRYQEAIMDFMGVSFIIGFIGICYHMTGFIASERETGMSTLIEAMMLTKRRWGPQVARLLSYHISFSLIYLPSWIFGSLVLRQAVFLHTSIGIVLVYHVLAGLALASMSLFGASIFRKSQLSGATVTIAYLLLAILAQSISWPRTATVTILSLLFAPANYTYFISLMARWEQQLLPTNLAQIAPNSPWQLPGVALWIFLIIQIIVYPILGALIERYLHGTSSNARSITLGAPVAHELDDNAVQLDDFSKIYKASLVRRMFSLISRPKDPVVAVDNLTLSAGRGQILALLGANGSGKSTTLDSIAGTNRITSGKITIDGSGGLGIAPQKNVLWDELTVEEHVRIFNRLKSPEHQASKNEIRELIATIDLAPKLKARSKTLSGGQKRKLQLGMMLTGGSAVCCVDEVSSGLDPISRRKIWDILLAERGRRTIIMTTHFLDEADLLADYIAILSKGTLRAKGSSVELKDKFGGGYRIHVHNLKDVNMAPDVDQVTKKVAFDSIQYIAPSSNLAAQVIKTLEAHGITDYKFSGPTIEDVFLQLAEEIREDGSQSTGQSSATSITQQADEKKNKSNEIVVAQELTKPRLELLSGKKINPLSQTRVLFLKRLTIFKNNSFPIMAAFFIPIIAAGLVTLFIKGQRPPGCTPTDQLSQTDADVSLFNMNRSYAFVAGPPSKITNDALVKLFLPLYLNTPHNSTKSPGGANQTSSDPASIFRNITYASTFDEFNNLVIQKRKNITLAAFWLGDGNSLPTIAYKAGGATEIANAWFGQWVLDMLLTNTTIASSYVVFDIPWAPDTGNSLQLLVYVCLALSAYPGFFALYPNTERRRNVRGLEYSNGVRTLPLWLAYLLFDFAIVIASSVIVIIIWSTSSQVWYHVEYVFVVFMLYGLASILLSYVISLFCKTQLSAYAITAAAQAVLFLIYLVAYLVTLTYAPVDRVDDYLLLVNFLVSAFAPIGSVVRLLFLELNLFSAACVDNHLAPYPGGFIQYGGPILYLILQAIFLFAILIWLDSGDVGSSIKRFFRPRKPDSQLDPQISDQEVVDELVRVRSSVANDGDVIAANTDGLRVVNLTKTFGKNTAVDNVTFGIKRGEVFALLGPNGAGKSTVISLIRGDIKPSVRGGDIFVEDVSVTKQLAAARSHLGVCPQFDAIDQMTVTEHLRFYARIRGIPDVAHNVTAVLQAVGLAAFAERQAHALSGGNKRKLSLGIALMGNPTVLLLDEPSSGLDAAAKRIMWRTLAATVHGRSILLTTHSMEEADALAGRAGILAKRMLAMGTTDQLRHRFGDALHVHLVCRGAPRTSDEDVRRIRRWIADELPGAEIEEKTYHGQMRFSIPASATAGKYQAISDHPADLQATEKSQSVPGEGPAALNEPASSQSAVARLAVLFEENRVRLGIEHYSVSPTTLDQVFLSVVGRHGIQEEGYETQGKKRWWKL